MNNGIIYAVNDDEKYIEMLVNSANSFWHFNPSLRDNTTIYVLTDAPDLQLKGINPQMKVKIIVLGEDAYSECQTASIKRFRKYSYYRFEIFNNDELVKLDNLIYLDVDTEFGDSIDELFIEGRTDPAIMVVKQNNHLSKPNPKYGGIYCDFYFNAGFMFITPKLIGEKTLRDIWGRITYLARTYPFKFCDQDSLNAALSAPEFKWLINKLPKTYNFSYWTCPVCSRKEADDATNFKMKHHGGAHKYEKKYIMED